MKNTRTQSNDFDGGEALTCRFCGKRTTTGFDHYDCEVFARVAAQSADEPERIQPAFGSGFRIN